MNDTRSLFAAVALVCAAISSPKPRAVAADAPLSSLTPEDACILELELPPGATITIDGRSYGWQRIVEFNRLTPGRYYLSSLKAKFSNGAKADVKLVLRGGWRVCLPLAEPAASRPEVVTQTAVFSGADDISADGRFVLSSSGPTAVLWDVATGRQLRTYGGFLEGVRLAKFRPGAKQVLASSYGAKVASLFDLASGELLRKFDSGDKIEVATFSPDGSVVLFAGGSLIRLCDAASGRTLRDLHSDIGGVRHAAFSPDGRRIAAASQDAVDLWDIETGQRTALTRGQAGLVNQVAFSRMGDRIYTAIVDSYRNTREATGEIAAWSLDGRRVGQFRAPELFEDLALARNGQELFVRGRFEDSGKFIGRLTVLRSDDLSPVRQLSIFQDLRLSAAGLTMPIRETPAAPLFPVTVSDSGNRMLLGDFLWQAEASPPLRRFKPKLADGQVVPELFLAKDGKRLIAKWRREWNKPWNVTAYDLADGGELSHFEMPACENLILSRDGRRLLAFDKNEAALWDVDDARELQRATFASSNRIRGRNAYGLSADGRLIASWSINPSREHLVQTPSGAVFQSRSGATIIREDVSESQMRREVAVWDAHDKRKLWGASLPWLADVGVFAFSADGEYLLARGVAESRTPLARKGEEHVELYPVCVLWLAATGRYLRSWRHGNMSCSYDVKYVGSPLTRVNGIGQAVPVREKVSGGGSGYSLGDSMRRRVNSKSQGPPFFETMSGGGAGFSLDGRLAWSWESDSKVGVIAETATGKVLRTVSGYAGWHDAELTPDGRYLALDPGDQTAAIFDVASGREVLRLAATADGEWLAATPDGMFDGSDTGRRRVAYRIGNGLNVVAVDRFFQDFYRPGLWSSIWRGERPVPEVQLGKSLPPLVKIAAPESGDVETPSVTLEVEAADQGGGISGLTLYQNGARVLAPGEKLRAGDRLRRSFRVALVEGENRLRVVSATADGSWESEPAEIVLRYTKPLAKSRLYVVAVGVNEYADANLNLSFAAKDARSLAELFQQRGKALYEQVHPATLTDGQATKSGIEQALKQAADQTRPQDTLLLFLAGHGVMVGQRYYFIPHEFRKQAERLEDDIRQQGLPADELSDDLGAAAALKRILIVDTCAAGGALKSALAGRSGFELRGAIERLSRTQGIFTIAASAASEQAQEVQELGHGVLSYALLAGLEAVDAGPLAEKHVEPSGAEHVVDVMDWFSFAAGQVPRLTERYYGVSQEVQTSTQGASFPLLPLKE